jgi:hypothetical protein
MGLGDLMSQYPLDQLKQKLTDPAQRTVTGNITISPERSHKWLKRRTSLGSPYKSKQ